VQTRAINDLELSDKYTEYYSRGRGLDKRKKTKPICFSTYLAIVAGLLSSAFSSMQSTHGIITHKCHCDSSPRGEIF